VIVGGGGRTVKETKLVTVPPGVVTEIGPVVAPVGTCAVMCVAELTTKLVSGVPLNLTLVAPVKFAPVMSTGVATGPLVGLNEVIAGGGGKTVKVTKLVAVPNGVVTEIGPVVAPVGTCAVRSVGELTTKLRSAVPLNFTPVAPVKFAPVRCTCVPIGPLVGVNELIVGGPRTVNEPPLLVVPPGVVTEIGPVVAPVGTWAVRSVGELTTKLGSGMPLNFTLVAPVKFAPVMSTAVPTGPLVGANELIVGGEVTVKGTVLVAVPLGVATVISPLVAPFGTTAWISESELTANVASTPLNLTSSPQEK